MLELPASDQYEKPEGTIEFVYSATSPLLEGPPERASLAEGVGASGKGSVRFDVDTNLDLVFVRKREGEPRREVAVNMKPLRGSLRLRIIATWTESELNVYVGDAERPDPPLTATLN